MFRRYYLSFQPQLAITPKSFVLLALEANFSMNLYTQFSVASSAVAFGTVAVLLWNSAGRNDMSYIYLSLTAPTIILGYHLLYLFTPFFDLDTTTSYTLVSSSTTPTDRPSTDRSHERPKLTIQTNLTTSEERNPLVSSTLALLCLILLTVLVGAISLSSGTVGFLNSLEEYSVFKSQARLECFATEYNMTVLDIKAGFNLANGTVTPEFEPVAQHMDRTSLSQLLGDIILVSRQNTDTTVPPSSVLGMQALLSLAQMVLLGSIVIIGMRRRVSRYSGECDEEEDVELEWGYVEDTDSVVDEEIELPANVIDYVRIQSTLLNPSDISLAQGTPSQPSRASHSVTIASCSVTTLLPAIIHPLLLPSVVSSRHSSQKSC